MMINNNDDSDNKQHAALWQTWRRYVRACGRHDEGKLGHVTDMAKVSFSMW